MLRLTLLGLCIALSSSALEIKNYANRRVPNKKSGS